MCGAVVDRGFGHVFFRDALHDAQDVVVALPQGAPYGRCAGGPVVGRGYGGARGLQLGVVYRAVRVVASVWVAVQRVGVSCVGGCVYVEHVCVPFGVRGVWGPRGAPLAPQALALQLRHWLLHLRPSLWNI